MNGRGGGGGGMGHGGMAMNQRGSRKGMVKNDIPESCGQVGFNVNWLILTSLKTRLSLFAVLGRSHRCHPGVSVDQFKPSVLRGDHAGGRGHPAVDLPRALRGVSGRDRKSGL